MSFFSILLPADVTAGALEDFLDNADKGGCRGQHIGELEAALLSDDPIKVSRRPIRAERKNFLDRGTEWECTKVITLQRRLRK